LPSSQKPTIGLYHELVQSSLVCNIHFNIVLPSVPVSVLTLPRLCERNIMMAEPKPSALLLVHDLHLSHMNSLLDSSTITILGDLYYIGKVTDGCILLFSALERILAIRGLN
jgi:hypothetical protein